ncbi:MAG TPA: hypothetical protein VFD70_06695 [Anaerolineae bacterium]|nr:hypothetical protein [Anaerolineae bacterium]
MQTQSDSPTVLTLSPNHAGFQRLAVSFQHARASHPTACRESFYDFAGNIAHVCIIGDALADSFHRAFAHVSADPTPAPALTLKLWDEGVTGVPYPLPRLPNTEKLPHLSDGEVLRGDETGRFVWAEKPDAVTWLDRQTNHLIGWRADGTQPPTHERSKPLSFFLALWLYDQDIPVLHAGMVARGRDGVLIAGGTRIGKTTTSLACLLAGWNYLGDDQIAVQAMHDGSFRAYSLFHSARVEPDHLARFPSLQPHALPSIDPLDHKSLLFMGEFFPQRIAHQATIRALVLPRISGDDQTRLTPARRVEALTYLAPTSLLTPFGIGRRRFQRITQLLGTVPCYWLELGSQLSGIPPILATLLPDSL